jgi:hypothetical protein
MPQKFSIPQPEFIRLKNVMLNDFIDWARSVTAGQITGAMEARITIGEPSNNPSARLDVDTPAAVARITCWESGDYDAEVINLESEQQTYVCRGTLQAGESLSERFRSFFEVLGIVSSDDSV